MNLRPKRGPRDAAFQVIQRRWDKKLRRSGFVDIEGGLDLNLTDDWTFRGGDGAKGGHVSLDDTHAAVSTSLRQEYWTTARHAAYAMREGEPNRDLFIAIAEAGNVQTVAKQFGMGRERARRVWGAFLWRVGIGKRRVS